MWQQLLKMIFIWEWLAVQWTMTNIGNKIRMEDEDYNMRNIYL